MKDDDLRTGRTERAVAEAEAAVVGVYRLILGWPEPEDGDGAGAGSGGAGRAEREHERPTTR